MAGLFAKRGGRVLLHEGHRYIINRRGRDERINIEHHLPIPTLYHEKIQEIAAMLNKEEVSSKMPTFEQIKTCLYDSRRKRLPALPTEWARVYFSREWTKMASG